MSTHVPGFQSFFRFLHQVFVMATLAYSSIIVKGRKIGEETPKSFMPFLQLFGKPFGNCLYVPNNYWDKITLNLWSLIWPIQNDARKP